MPSRPLAPDAALPEKPLTRFAPSPTGYLHLGHVVNAIHVWGFARARGGRVLLRIEDHDRLRCRPAFEAALLEDLAWLGFEPDLGPVRQSDDPKAYEDALDRLMRTHRVFACDCSRHDLAARAPARPGVEVPYSGRCRNRNLAIGPRVGVRIELPPGIVRFQDARFGAQAQEPAAQCGDLLLRDRDGNWTYQFAVTVDDIRQGVDLIVRGEDLLSSTGRQLQLASMLGRREPPVLFHHGLIVNARGMKLSKSSRETGVRDLRAGGAAAAGVIGLAAAAGGLLDEPRPLAATEVASLFA